MHGSEYVSDFLVVFADETDIWADTLDITVNDVTEFIRFICSLDNGMILVLGRCKSKVAVDLMVSVISCLSSSKKADGEE
jgi:hypothetical protein